MELSIICHFLMYSANNVTCETFKKKKTWGLKQIHWGNYSGQRSVICTIIHGIKISKFSITRGYSERAGFHVLFSFMNAVVFVNYSVSSYRSNCVK